MGKSSYYPDGNIPKAVDINANTFNILSLNCATLNAKFDELKIKLQQIHNNGTEIHAICLQETWLTNDSDTSLFQIDLVSQGRLCSAHAGLVIYQYSSKLL